jgi:hypothetical protein
MKKNYVSPELYEIKVEDVIAASVLSVENEGNGLSLDYSELA